MEKEVKRVQQEGEKCKAQHLETVCRIDRREIDMDNQKIHELPTQHYIPTINGTATTNEEKATQFREEITNRILRKNFNHLQTPLLALAQACLDLGYFPSTFKKMLTVVLRKPNKPDYTKPNEYILQAHRPQMHN